MSKKPSTQKYLDIAEIRDDVIILTNGGMRMVLMTSSINFALKSEDEQEASINSYVTFLNYIDFPLQIVIQSRPLNINTYLDDLEKMEQAQANELLRMQTKDYRDYVKELVELGEIMTKRFYVVVPYNPLGDAKRGFFSRLKDTLMPSRFFSMHESSFKEHRKSLMERVDVVVGGLTRMGLHTTMLSTQQLIELFYNTYNPDLTQSQALKKLDELEVETG